MATRYRRTSLTGGTAADLDGIDGAGLNDGDYAFVFDTGNLFYLYVLDASSGATESSPQIISPDDNAGNKRWLLQYQTGTAAPLVNLLGNSGFGVWSNSDANKGLGSCVFDSGGVTACIVGDTFTGNTSSATGKIIAISAISPGSWAGGDAEGTITLGACTGRFQDNETVTTTTGGADTLTVNMAPTAAGVDLMRNSDFTADEDPPQGWTAVTSTLTTDAGGQVGNMMTVASSGANVGKAYQDLTTVIGKLYKLELYFKKGTSDTGKYMIGITADEDSIYDSGALSDAAWTAKSYTFEATATTTRITMQTTDATDTETSLFDEIACYEITPCCTEADTLGPDGWSKASSACDLYREHWDGGTNTKDGAFYALKIVPHGTANVGFPSPVVRGLAEWYSQFSGKIVTLGMWVKGSVASKLQLGMYDGSTVTTGGYHTGGGSWEWLELTVTISASASTFNIYLGRNLASDAGIWHISQPMLVFGSSIGEGNYMLAPGEVVRFEKDIVLTDYDMGVGDVLTDIDAEINIETQSEGKIPKGIAEIYANIRAMDSAVAATIGVWMGPDTTYCANGIGDIGIELHGLGNDVKGQAAGWVRCDSGGDPWLFINESGAGTLDCEIRVQGVRLR